MTEFRTLALDFDGVMNTYNGWKGADELFQPHPEIRLFLRWCRDNGWRVKIHTSRPADKVNERLKKYGLDGLIEQVCNEKPLALVYIDDRAIRFAGKFEPIVAALESMEIRTHWEQEVVK